MGENNTNYDEWVQKVSQAAGITEEKILEEEITVIEQVSSKRFWQSLGISCSVFLVALLPRLFFIFFISGTQNAGVGWYNDSYHHWQIAYLTQQIGLSQGFLRLWDLQGMEYFWGLLHPMVLSALFTITGSADILISRLFNVVLGSLSTVLVYWIITRDFNWKAGIAAAVLISINPIGIFTDTSGMQEPLGIFLFLLGFFFLAKKIWLTGFFWGLAALTRAEYWVFSLMLVGIVLVFDKKQQGKLGLVITYGTIVLLYMKYLLDKTGNALYPIYWNFLGNAAGKWEKAIPLTVQQIEIRYVFLVILLLAAIIGIYLLIKRPKLYLFSLLGIGNFMFLALFVGFSQYLKSYLPRFWVDRIFWLPYMWVSCVVAIGLFYFLPKYLRTLGIWVGVIFLGVLAVGLQHIWEPIMYYSTLDTTTLPQDMSYAKQVATYYQHGNILIPGTDPIFTYALYKNGIAGAHIRGEMFGPFYYMSKDPFANWEVNRTIVFSFLQKQQVSLMLFDPGQIEYQELIVKEPTHFIKVATIGRLQLYRVSL